MELMVIVLNLRAKYTLRRSLHPTLPDSRRVSFKASIFNKLYFYFLLNFFYYNIILSKNEYY